MPTSPEGRRGWVLVLFDSLDVRAEAIPYGLELATRTGASLALLLLLPHEVASSLPVGADWVSHLEKGVAGLLADHVERAEAAGCAIETEVRLGDPPSELLKFLAGARAVTTVVWGGRPGLVGQEPHRRRNHWLTRIRDRVGCPVVVPSLRPDATRPSQDILEWTLDKEGQ